VSLAAKEERSIETVTNKEEIQNTRLNDAENAILNMLLSVVNDSSSQLETSTYEAYLVNYFSGKEIEFSMATAEKVAFRLNDITALKNLENENDIRKMSLDGRGVAIHISKQIYRLCGLKLEYNIRGDIQQLKDSRGNYLFKENILVQKEVFDINSAVIILAVWMSLLNLCIFIAKKNQLYIKDGEYEFDKKGFAQ
jgi:hypothetical protein